MYTPPQTSHGCEPAHSNMKMCVPPWSPYTLEKEACKVGREEVDRAEKAANETQGKPLPFSFSLFEYVDKMLMQ